MDEALLSVADAARRLGVTPAAVVAMERGGKLPALRTEGGMRLFRERDVKRLAEVRRSAAQTKGGAVPATSDEGAGR